MDKLIIEKISFLLKKSENILFITGAALSADSGLPTYRGIGGLDGSRGSDENIPMGTALSAFMLKAKPEIIWKYLARAEQACRKATFNRGHEVIVEMENHFKRVWVLTQSVDGLHRSAGTKNLIDIYGDIHNLYCISCRFHKTVKDFSQLEMPPKCPECNFVLRPEIVLFGEMMPGWRYRNFLKELDQGFDLIFSVGLTTVSPFILSAVNDVKKLEVPTIEINPEKSELSEVVDIKLSCGSAEGLSAVWDKYLADHN